MKAMAGSPSATARSQARRIVEESAVSHDQRVCTWLSGAVAIASLWILPRRPQPPRGGPFCRRALPTVVGMSTAAPPSEITGSSTPRRSPSCVS